MRDETLTELARVLDEAWATGTPIEAPTRLHPDLSVADAYEIQEKIVAMRLDGERRRAGWKLGLTSAPPPATPIAGTLLTDMIVPSGSELSMQGLVGPMVEAELVVRMGETIEGPCGADELMRGPHKVGPGIEVVDYRTVDAGGVVDWIADNSTVAYAVVGRFQPITELDLAAVEASLRSDGRQLAVGTGSQVMGNPLEAVAWLTRHLGQRGHPLERGQIVLTGSLTGHHPVPSGEPSRFTADFGPLGEVSVSFTP